MKARRLALLGAILAGILGAVPAHAVENCSIDSGSADTPQMQDQIGDGFLSINVDPTLAPLDSTDVTSVWFQRDDAGRTILHVRVVASLPAQSNIVYYVLWTWKGNDDPAKQIRFIRLQPRAYGDAYRYGYFDTAASVTGSGTYRSEGDTTGTYTPGAPGVGGVVAPTPGEISAVVPFDKLGSPQPGDELGALSFKSGVLAGSPGLPNGVTLPVSNPAPFTALVEPADDGLNGDACESILV